MMEQNRNGNTVATALPPKDDSRRHEDNEISLVDAIENDVLECRTLQPLRTTPIGKHIDQASVISEKLFIVQTANEWIKKAAARPIPNTLYKDLWYENEVCLCFAGTGIGKSIKATQIAEEISSKQKVLYFDFELSDKQFERRYSVDFKNPYQFNDNFYRIEINQDADIPESFKDFDDYLIHSLEETVIETGAKIVVIDNLTYLKTETEKAKDALPLMKRLNRLKKKLGLSILVLAHTPKRDETRPITVNDISGSKMLANFADSIFAIGQSSTDKGIRYIKQIKTRNSEIIYDADNVMLFHLHKPDNFLHFDFIGYGNEYEHLKVQNQVEASELELQVQTILKNEKGVTAYRIAQRLFDGDEKKFNSFKVKINRIVNRLNKSQDSNSSNT